MREKIWNWYMYLKHYLPLMLKGENIEDRWFYCKTQNPYTYNKRHFYSEIPKEGTKEWKKIMKANDGWILIKYIFPIIKKLKYASINGSYNDKNFNEYLASCSYEKYMAFEYGLDKYGHYLDFLIENANYINTFLLKRQ